MRNGNVYRDSLLSAQDGWDFGAEQVLLATGCCWRKDGFGRSNGLGIANLPDHKIFSPDDVMDGKLPDGPVLIFDDDYFYYGSVIAEKLCKENRTVIYVTPDDTIAAWSGNTLDYRHIHWRLAKLDVQQIVAHNLLSFNGHAAQLQQLWNDKILSVACASVVLITARLPQDDLHQTLLLREAQWADAGVKNVHCIGDALAPGLIAHAVYSGHRFAREFDEIATDDVPFKRHFHCSDEQLILRA
jgi:dimethylamine/trimethylamine dehydrogenase